MVLFSSSKDLFMSAPLWTSMADPIHGMIRFKRNNTDHKLILDVMNSRAFQRLRRLRRIRQMGMAEFVFPGATHNRFVHSIGATWLMIKAIDHLNEYEEGRAILQQPYDNTDVPLQQLLLLAVLVHDIGHTPLSHTLEEILPLKDRGLLHDSYWNRLILEQDEELRKIWTRYNPELPYAVCRFNRGETDADRHFLADLVSSQLDMDRLDYLLRDSHYLGVQYGRIEIERIILNMSIGTTPAGTQAIAFREEALPAIEHYLFGRYEAYKMALHSLDKASETLLKKTLERFKWVRDHDKNAGHPADLLYRLISDGRSLSADEYLMLDDCYLWDKVNLWARYSEDELLRALSNRLLGHDLFKFIEISNYSEEFDGSLELVRNEMRDYFASRNLSFDFSFDQMIVAPKSLYQPMPMKPPIWIRQKKGGLADFADITTLPLETDPQQGRRCLLFVWDKEAKAHLQKILEKHFEAKSLQTTP
jgi:uncharacterized protein